MDQTRREFLTSASIALAGVAVFPDTVIAQASNVVVQGIVVTKNAADEAAKHHPGGAQAVLGDMDKLKGQTASVAGTTAAVGVGSGAATAVAAPVGRVGTLTNAVGGITNRFKRGGNDTGADFEVQDQVQQSSLSTTLPVILVYGSQSTANSLKDILVKTAGLPSTIVIRYVDPAENKDFKDHFAGKGDRIVVWPVGAAIDKPSAVLNTVEAATGGLVNALKGTPKPPAPAAAPRP